MAAAAAAGPLARSFHKVGHSLKMVTYNILSKKYAGFNSYCPAAWLDPAHRTPLILAELAHYDADLVCLQEVDQDLYQDTLRPHMQGRGYSGLFYARKTGPVPGPPEGVALFYRHALFTHQASTTIRLADLKPTDIGCGPAAEGSGAWRTLQQQEDGAVLALLQHQPSGTILLAACTHLFWNPTYPDVKVLQAALLCRSLMTFLTEHGLDAATPVALGGDFNSLWRKYKSDTFDEVPSDPGFVTSGVYQLLSTGQLPADHHDHPHSRRRPGEAHGGEFAGVLLTTCGIKLHSMSLAAHGREPPLTNRTAGFAGCLDYLWISPGAFQVTETLTLPYPEPPPGWMDPLSEVAFWSIPDQHFPTDHIAVGGTLLLHGTQQGS